MAAELYNKVFLFEYVRRATNDLRTPENADIAVCRQCDWGLPFRMLRTNYGYWVDETCKL